MLDLQNLVGNEAVTRLIESQRQVVPERSAERAGEGSTSLAGTAPTIQRVVVNVPIIGGNVTGVEVSQDRPSVTVGRGGAVGAQKAHVTAHSVVRHAVVNAMEAKPWNLALRGLYRLFEYLTQFAVTTPADKWLAAQIDQSCDAITSEIADIIDADDGDVIQAVPAEERSGVLARYARTYIELRARLAWTAANENSTKTGEAGHGNALGGITWATNALNDQQKGTLLQAIHGLYEFQPRGADRGSDPKLAGMLAARHLTEVFTGYLNLRKAWYTLLRPLFGTLAWNELFAAAPTTAKSWKRTNPAGAEVEFKTAFNETADLFAWQVRSARLT